MSDICYDRFNRAYYCNNGGLGYGARIGIGIGIAVAVIALIMLCSYWRRRQLKSQFAKYRPPALPFTNNTSSSNQYANNPPPPPNASGFSSNQYGSNPNPPPQTYQPSMAGQYQGGAKQTAPQMEVNDNNHEHGYEWEQAREQERMARTQSPPGYNVEHTQDVTGYAPPPGPPPR